MDYSRCIKEEERDSEDIRNVTLVEDIATRLKEAAKLAIRELETVRDIPSAIEILNQKKSSIVIDELINKNGDKFLVIYKGSNQGKSYPLFKDGVGGFRYAYLRNIKDCRIFVKCKLLRIMFHDCEDCQISLRAPVIGMAEFFHCKNSNINIRISDGDIPITRIEKCRNIQLFQSNDCLVYLIYLSVNIKGIIVDQNSGARQEEYDDLGKLFWDNDQGQTFVCLSREEGFASTTIEYALNDLSQHIIIKNSKKLIESDEESREEIFGTTPPVGSGWKKYLDK